MAPDNTPLLQTAKEDPARFLQRFRPPALIDEIQKAPELLPYIKMTIDESGTYGLFWLIGSQPLHLMKEVSESLVGRIDVIEMLGLSNSKISGITSEPCEPGADYFIRRTASAKPYGISKTYERIYTGSLPGISALPKDVRGDGSESHLDTHIMHDIRDLAQIDDKLKFRRFVATCATLTSKPIVYAELTRLADINQQTAKTWLSFLMSSYPVKVVEPYANNLLKRLNRQPIMHFLDTGLAAYLAGWSCTEALELGAMSGQYSKRSHSEKCTKAFSTQENDRRCISLESTIRRRWTSSWNKTASRAKDTRNLGSIDPVTADEVPKDLTAFKPEIGMRCILCMINDTFPVTSHAWAVPIWSV